VIFTEHVEDKVLRCFPKSAYRYITVYMRVVPVEGTTYCEDTKSKAFSIGCVIACYIL